MSDDLLNDLLGFDEGNKKPKRTEIERAPFNYLGSKFALINELQKHLPVRRKWIDHFCGSGVVTFNRPESPIEVMNDRYGGVVAFYRCLQNPKKAAQLVERLKFLPYSREEFDHCATTWVTEEDDVERAAKWYTMVRLSVYGKGHSFARITNSGVINPVDKSLELFMPIHHRIRKVIIENLDVMQCLKDFDSIDAVHYFDPPYVNADQGAYEHKWNRNKLEALLDGIARAQGFCALSGYEDEQISGRKFWTKKLKFKVKVGAEMRAFTEENHKSTHGNVVQTDSVEEVLWIKDHV